MASYSIVGLGKLGASVAAAIAGRGGRVVGVDVDRARVNRVNAGRAPVFEMGLAEQIAANRERLRATTDYREAILESEITLVVVPTPSTPSGELSLRHAASAFESIGTALAEKGGYHLVVLVSSVLPGASRRLVSILEQRSGKTCGADFGFCYNPQLIALGTVIRDFLHPEFTLIGEFDERSGDTLAGAFAEILPDRPPMRRMSLENAELAKIALNAYVTMKITFANQLADLCERLPQGDVDAVTSALGLDTRIGPRYLKGGLGYGGPCFPRDNLAIARMARTLGASPDLWETTDCLNRSLPSTLMPRLGVAIDAGTTVAILGLAYKPLSPALDESQSILLARDLMRRGARVVAHDPLAADLSPDELADLGITLRSVEECLDLASLVVIASPDPVYARLDADDFVRPGRSTMVVVDCWRLLSEKLSKHSGVRYLAIGRNLGDAGDGARLASLSAAALER